MDGLFHGKSKFKMDDDWRYPYVRKPPDGNGLIVMVDVFYWLIYHYTTI